MFVSTKRISAPQANAKQTLRSKSLPTSPTPDRLFDFAFLPAFLKSSLKTSSLFTKTKTKTRNGNIPSRTSTRSASEQHCISASNSFFCAPCRTHGCTTHTRIEDASRICYLCLHTLCITLHSSARPHLVQLLPLRGDGSLSV